MFYLLFCFNATLFSQGFLIKAAEPQDICHAFGLMAQNALIEIVHLPRFEGAAYLCKKIKNKM